MDLEFYHETRENYLEYHRWPFVYLHGDAEYTTPPSDDGFASDICVSNMPMDDYGPINDALKEPGSSVELRCKVDGFDAVAVIARRSSDILPFQKDCFLSGRIALLSDEKALEHARDVKAWR